MNLRPASRFAPALIIFTLIAALFGNFSGHASVAQAEANPAPANTAQCYGALPLSFIANAGQVDPAVRFQVRSGGGTLSFEQDGVMLTLSPDPSPVGRVRGSKAFPTGHDWGIDPAHDALSPMQWEKGPGIEGQPPSVSLRLTFDRANPNAHIGGAAQLPGIANFFIGNDPSQWHTNVPTYAGVVYHDLYPGVDLQYGGHRGVLKGTYTLAAGVDPSLIRWRYTGADSVSLDSTSGNLTIHAADDVTLTEQSPIAWQTRADGSQTPVMVGYTLNTDGSVQFAPEGYDLALPLVIDPGLVYSTYLGNNVGDYGTKIAVDSHGNAYITGSTVNAAFPTTAGVFQATFGGGSRDVFVSKLNATGSALIYSTFLGGSGSENATGIALDASGNAYITGGTNSSNYPLSSNPLQMTLKGTQNVFVSKLNDTGSILVYSTYLGGSGFDNGSGIAVDANGNAYIVGTTSSTNFPTTPGVFQPTFGGGNAIRFITKLDNSGSTLSYSTYLNGNSYPQDDFTEVAVDGSGNAYVTGGTSSATFPTTPLAFQTTFAGGGSDVFVTKLNATGSALVYSTFIGGSGDDYGATIAVDMSGNVYVSGGTSSSNFPLTASAYQTSYSGGTGPYGVVFVSKLNAAGNVLLYSTYLGTAGSGNGLAIDSNGYIYVTGYTASGFPITASAYQSVFGGGPSDAFVSKLNPSLSGLASLVYSSYLGGSGNDAASAIALDRSGYAYITGGTFSTNFPTTPGAYQTAFGSGGCCDDVFVSKLALIPINSIGVYRAGTFYLRLHNSTGYADISAAFNPATKPYPVVGDWAGAGFDTIGVLDQSNGQFFLRNSNSPGAADEQFVLGNPADVPLAGKWAANATHAGVGVFRPSNGLIYLKNNLTTGYADFTMVLGIPGDQGLAGDWNGDGQDSPGVYRPSNITFYLTDQVTNGSVIGSYQFQYGVSGDAPVVGDWVGQGHDGVGLFRQSNGYTYLRNSLTTGYADNTFVYGIAGDVPVAGHWQLAYPPAPMTEGNTARNPVNVLVPPTAAPVPTAGGLSD